MAFLNSIAFTVAPCLLGISSIADLVVLSFYPRESRLLWRMGLVKLEVCLIKASSWGAVFSRSNRVRKPPQNATLMLSTVLKISPRHLAPL